jgi:hypothetical protein
MPDDLPNRLVVRFVAREKCRSDLSCSERDQHVVNECRPTHLEARASKPPKRGTRSLPHTRVGCTRRLTRSKCGSMTRQHAERQPYWLPLQLHQNDRAHVSHELTADYPKLVFARTHPVDVDIGVEQHPIHSSSPKTVLGATDTAYLLVRFGDQFIG